MPAHDSQYNVVDVVVYVIVTVVCFKDVVVGSSEVCGGLAVVVAQASDRW